MDKVLREKIPADQASLGKAQQRNATEVKQCNTDPRITKLYSEYAPELSQGIRIRYGDGPPDPDDVMQEAFRRIYEKEDTTKVRNLRAFIWRIARNLVLDAKKSEETRSKYDFEIENIFFPLKGHISSPETVIVAKEQLQAVNQLLLEMPDKRRRALMLYRLEGLTLEQIGKRLGISRRAVSKHISRAHVEISSLFVEDLAD